MADGYVVFDGPQDAEFRSRVARFLAWHREQELPRYETFLARAAENFRHGLTRDEVARIWEQVKEHYRATTDHAAPEMAVILANVSLAQIEAIERKFSENNAKYAREYIKGGEEEQRRTRHKRNSDLARDWLGELSQAQELQPKAANDRLPLVYSPRLADHERRQREFIAMLKDRLGLADLAARLRRWLSRWEEGLSAEFDRLITAYEEQSIQACAEFDRSLTPALRAHARASRAIWRISASWPRKRNRSALKTEAPVSPGPGAALFCRLTCSPGLFLTARDT